MSRLIILRRFDVQGVWGALTMGGNGERLHDRLVVLAGAATAVLAVALYLPVDRLLGATNRLAWLAVAIAVVYLMWMLPTLVVAWTELDGPRAR